MNVKAQQVIRVVFRYLLGLEALGSGTLSVIREYAYDYSVELPDAVRDILQYVGDKESYNIADLQVVDKALDSDFAASVMPELVIYHYLLDASDTLQDDDASLNLIKLRTLVGLPWDDAIRLAKSSERYIFEEARDAIDALEHVKSDGFSEMRERSNAWVKIVRLLKSIETQRGSQ